MVQWGDAIKWARSDFVLSGQQKRYGKPKGSKCWKNRTIQKREEHRLCVWNIGEDRWEHWRTVYNCKQAAI